MPYPIEKYLTLLCLILLIPANLAAALIRHLSPDYYPQLVNASRILLAWLTVFAVPLAVGLGAHERFNLLGRHLGPKSRRNLSRFVENILALFAAAMLIASLGPLLESLLLATSIGKHLNILFGKSRPADLPILAAIPPAALLTLIRLRQRRMR